MTDEFFKVVYAELSKEENEMERIKNINKEIERIDGNNIITPLQQIGYLNASKLDLDVTDNQYFSSKMSNNNYRDDSDLWQMKFKNPYNLATNGNLGHDKITPKLNTLAGFKNDSSFTNGNVLKSSYGDRNLNEGGHGYQSNKDKNKLEFGTNISIIKFQGQQENFANIDSQNGPNFNQSDKYSNFNTHNTSNYGTNSGYNKDSNFFENKMKLKSNSNLDNKIFDTTEPINRMTGDIDKELEIPSQPQLFGNNMRHGGVQSHYESNHIGGKPSMNLQSYGGANLGPNDKENNQHYNWKEQAGHQYNQNPNQSQNSNILRSEIRNPSNYFVIKKKLSGMKFHRDTLTILGKVREPLTILGKVTIHMVVRFPVILQIRVIS